MMDCLVIIALALVCFVLKIAVITVISVFSILGLLLSYITLSPLRYLVLLLSTIFSLMVLGYCIFTRLVDYSFIIKVCCCVVIFVLVCFFLIFSSHLHIVYCDDYYTELLRNIDSRIWCLQRYQVETHGYIEWNKFNLRLFPDNLYYQKGYTQGMIERDRIITELLNLKNNRCRVLRFMEAWHNKPIIIKPKL